MMAVEGTYVEVVGPVKRELFLIDIIILNPEKLWLILRENGINLSPI